MRAKLPIIGLVKTGKDADSDITIVKTKKVTKGASDLLGGVLFNKSSKLSDEKTVSNKILEANKGWVYKNNDVIAREVSKLDFELYRIDVKSGEVIYTEIEQHPILDLLDRFNDTTTKNDGIYITQSHKKLTGDAFWLLDGPQNNPTNIFVLQPDKIELKIGDPTDTTSSLIEGYTYKDVIDGKKVERFYTKEEILHFKTPNPNNMFRGLGVVEAVATTIDLDFITEDVTRKFFDNGAITNFVLSTENKINDDQLKRLKAELRAAYSGSKNAYQTMILGGGLKPENITMSNRELEFLAQLEWYRDKIMAAFGNTKASLGLDNEVNRSAGETLTLNWKRTTIMSEMEAIVNTLNEFLVPLYGDKLVLGFKNPVPEDRTSKVDEVVKLRQADIITIDEARAFLDIDERGGNASLLNIERDITQVPESLKSVNLKQVLRSYDITSIVKIQKDAKDAARQIASKIIKSRRNKEVAPVITEEHDGFNEDTLVDYWKKQIHIVEHNEARFKNALEQFIDYLEVQALGNLESEIAKKSVTKELFNEDQSLNKAVLDFTPILTETAVIAGSEALKLINNDAPYLGFDVKSQLERNILKFTQSMLDTEREKIIAVINQGLADGASVPQIRDAITNAYAEMKRVQAERVTRTEVIRVSNQASVDAWKKSGVVIGKQWLTAQDGRVDQDCEFYNGKVINLTGTYAKTEYGSVKEPPLHPNCRCVVIPVLVNSKSNKMVTIQLDNGLKINNAELQERIKELESKIDKRTKTYKQLKAKAKDDEVYIKSLEKHLGVSDEQTTED